MIKVLIVEDDSDLAKIYKSALVYDGMYVDIAKNSVEANKYIKNSEKSGNSVYDVIFLDIVLGNDNGLNILKKIKGDKDQKKTKVLLLSNVDSPSEINNAYTLGADGYIIKSMILSSQLSGEVKQVLGINE